jgi:hypothetical protein
MNPESTAMVLQTLALPDEDLFALDSTATAALQARLALQLQPRSFTAPPGAARAAMPELRAIAAPARVDWTRHSRFPVLLAEVRSNLREWAVHAAQNRVLVLSNLDTGEVGVRAPIEQPRRVTAQPPSRGGQPPDAFNAALSSIVVMNYDLLRWFERDHLEGRFALTALEYDLVSNTASVNAVGAVGTTPATLPARLRVRPGAVAAVDPPAAGVVMAVPERVASSSAAPIRVAVSLPRARVALIGAGDGSRDSAVLAATLMLVHLDRNEPAQLQLAVPATVVNGGVVASFELDLRHALTAGATPGDWLAYLVIGDTVTGPRPLRIENR